MGRKKAQEQEKREKSKITVGGFTLNKKKWMGYLPIALLIGFPVLLIAGLLFYLVDGNWAIGALLGIFSLFSLFLGMATVPRLKKIYRKIGRIGSMVMAGVLAILLIAVICLTVFLNTGLFQTQKVEYVLRFYHTSNPWLVTAFTSQANVERILAENGVEQPDVPTDIDSIKVSTTTSTTASAPSSEATTTTTAASTTTTTTTKAAGNTTTGTRATRDQYPGTVIYEEEGLRVLEIKTTYFTARLVEVADPKRVSLGVTNRYGSFGEKLLPMCQRTDSLLGINAGGFYDPKGSGNGGIPSYLLVRDYEIVYTDGAATHNVIGLTEEGVLVLGVFTNQQIKDAKIKEATSFKPFLIVNGKKSTFYGAAGGRDPRSAIGQREDGTILLLTADGRQSGMEGANQRDMANIMEAYDAYNASNLDGGSSTTMVLNNQIINKPCSLYGPRYLNTAWLVSRK